MTGTSRREGTPVGLGLLVGGTSLVEGTLFVGGELLVVGGRLPAAGEGTVELTGEGAFVAVGHAEQAFAGVPAEILFAPGDGVGSGEPGTEVTVPEGLGVGGTAESVLSGGETAVGLPLGIVGEGEITPPKVPVGEGTGDETSVGVLVGEGELSGLLVATGVGVAAEGLVAGVVVGTGVMVGDTGTPEGVSVGIDEVRVVVKPVLSKVVVTSELSLMISLVITTVSLIVVNGSGLGSRFS